MSGSSAELIHVRNGLVAPLPALLALLALERAGHSIHLAGDDIVVERGANSPPMDAAALEALRRWKRHAWLIVRNLSRDDIAPPGGQLRGVAGNPTPCTGSPGADDAV